MIMSQQIQYSELFITRICEVLFYFRPCIQVSSLPCCFHQPLGEDPEAYHNQPREIASPQQVLSLLLALITDQHLIVLPGSEEQQLYSEPFPKV